ncbi:MAG: O-antigen ligase family protein [Chloroflexota bacterium]
MTRRTARRARATSPTAPAPTTQLSRLGLLGVALVCLKVALLPVVFDPPADMPFTVGKALFSHALTYALAGVLVGLLVEFGRSFFVWSWLHVPVLAFLLANVVATLFAANTVFALYGAHARMLGLGTIVDCVVLYFAIVFLVRTRAEAIAVIASVLAGSAVVLLYELVQFVGKDPGVWNVDPSVRPFSTLGQTTTLAEYLTVLATGTAALGLFEAKLRLALRVGLLVLSVLLVAGMLVTQTRSALLGVVAGALVLIALTWIAHPSRRARVMSLAGAVGATAVIALVLVATPLGARVLGTVEVPDVVAGDDASGPRLEQSADVRLALYRIAFEMVRERPLFGYGPDNVSSGVPTYRTDNEPDEVQQSLATSAHGWLAQVAATSGILGLAAFVAISIIALVLTVRAGFQPVAWAALGMLGAFLGAGLTTVNDVGTDWLFWASAGAIAAVTAPRVTAVRRRMSSRRVAGLLCAIVGLAVVAVGWNALDASRVSKLAFQERLAGRYAQAIDLSLRATRTDPGRPEYWEGLGLGYVGVQRFADAAGAFTRASALTPYDVRYVGEVARAYAVLFQRGDGTYKDKARDLGNRVVAIDPNNPQAHLTRAVVMQVTGDLAEALKSVERALALDPSSKNAQLGLTATQVFNASGRTADAIAIARRAIGALDLNDSVQIRVELARALVAAGQPAQALAELDAALAIRPNDPAALQLRTQIRGGTTQ